MLIHLGYNQLSWFDIIHNSCWFLRWNYITLHYIAFNVFHIYHCVFTVTVLLAAICIGKSLLASLQAKTNDCLIARLIRLTAMISGCYSVYIRSTATGFFRLTGRHCGFTTMGFTAHYMGFWELGRPTFPRKRNITPSRIKTCSAELHACVNYTTFKLEDSIIITWPIIIRKRFSYIYIYNIYIYIYIYTLSNARSKSTQMRHRTCWAPMMLREPSVSRPHAAAAAATDAASAALDCLSWLSIDLPSHGDTFACRRRCAKPRNRTLRRRLAACWMNISGAPMSSYDARLNRSRVSWMSLNIRFVLDVWHDAPGRRARMASMAWPGE